MVIKSIFKKKKKGTLSLPYVILCMGALALFISMLFEYRNILMVRNFESVTDLASVESLRLAVSENALKNEVLQLDYDKDGAETVADMNMIRDTFLEKVQNSMIANGGSILRVEIPQINSQGEIIIPQEYQTAAFPNSHTNSFHGPYGNESRYMYFLGGDTSETSAMSIVCDRTNLASSGTKIKTSYMLTAKVVVIYKTNGLVNTFSEQSVKYTDIFSGNVTVVKTQRLDNNVNAITLQVVGKVTLR